MSSGVADIVSFFNGMSSSNDVGGALSNSALAFKIAMVFIMFVGGLAMAVWIGRIAIDILVITLRGTGVEKNLGRFGTGKSDTEGTVGSYIKNNLVNIILVIILIFFLMSGFLFRLIAIALSGFGALANKLFNLDVQGILSTVDIEAYKEGIQAQRPTTNKQNYDSEVGVMRAELANLYDMAEKGQNSTSNKYVEKYSKSQRTYTHAFARASLLASDEGGNLDPQQFKLPKDYFTQHKDGKSLSPICVEQFLDDDVLKGYGVDGSCDKGTS